MITEEKEEEFMIIAAIAIGFEWNENLNCFTCNKDQIITLCTEVASAAITQTIEQLKKSK